LLAGERLKIFISYAREDRAIAESIELALRAQGHEVFFDRNALPAGEEYNIRIRRAIERCDLMIFLVSEQALDAGSYTLTELEIAGAIWPHPGGRLLPVMLQRLPSSALPPLLRSVTVLQTDGNLTAAVADAVHRLALARRRRQLRTLLAVALALMIAGIGIALVRTYGEPRSELTGRDGAPARLIPAGGFMMGDDEESPRRQIHLDAFYIDQFEVTTARYARFLESTSQVAQPEDWDRVDPTRASDLPVIGVNWHDAVAYCAWAQRRLPTEAEWEKAARGADERRYPWGNAPPTADHANFGNTAPDAYAGGLSPVGQFEAGRSPYGAHDMAGNAAEWVSDWHSESFNPSVARNPTGPPSGTAKVIRGGGRFDPAERITVTKRYFGGPELRREDVGFRCARDAPLPRTHQRATRTATKGTRSRIPGQSAGRCRSVA
jgi:formylglycine-generating enzyme required for sulfatase activity